MKLPVRPRSPRRWSVLFALLGAACGGAQERVIADGWHYGAEAASQRAFEDSLHGLGAGPVPVRYVGVERLAERPEFGARFGGGFLGDIWAPELLASGPVSVVVGHPGSMVTNASARYYAEARVPLIVPNASARGTVEVEPWVFRLAPDDREQGAAMVAHALDSLGARRLAVVFVGDAYGVGILQGVRTAMAARGLPLADEVEIPIGACSLDGLEPPRLATQAMLRRRQPDAVLVALPLTPAHCVLHEIATQAPATWILGSDALDEADVDRWVRARIPAARLRIATLWRPRDDSATRAFRAAFVARRGREPQGVDALHYDALALAAAAVRATDGSPDDVHAWLTSLGKERAAFEGLTGAISFQDPRRRVPFHFRAVD